MSVPRTIGPYDPLATDGAGSSITFAVQAPASSGGDDSAMLQSLINTYGALGVKIYLQLDTYLINTGLVLSGIRPVVICGVPFSGRATGGTVIRANAAMNAVVTLTSDSHQLCNVVLDGNQLATYDLYSNGCNLARFDRVAFINAIKDGWRNNPINGNQGHNFYECYWGNNGTTYRTAGLAAVFAYGHTTAITGTATTTAGNATVQIVGSSTDLTTLGLRKDDLFFIGASVATGQLMIIESVTANTIVVQGNAANLPAANLAGQQFAIGSGDGFHDEPSGAGGVHGFFECIASGSSAGFRFGSLYGSRLYGKQADFNNMVGISIGRADNVSGAPNGMIIDGMYFESGAGVAPFFLGSSFVRITTTSLSPTSVLSAGARLANGTWQHGDGVEDLQTGLRQNLLLELRDNAGTLQHRIVADHWNAFGSTQAGKINGATTAWTNTPTLDSTHGFAAGVGVYDVGGGVFEVLLDTPNAQNSAMVGSTPIEFNSTGTAYVGQLTPASVNVNGVTEVRPAIFLSNLAGAQVSVTAATLAGKSIGLRVTINLR